MQENIPESFKYYDNSLKKYKKYYNINKKLKLKLKLNVIDDKPTFELKNNNTIIMKGDYNLIGLYGYNKGVKSFRWGWDCLYTTNNKNNTSYLKKDILINKNENISKDILININDTYLIKKIINYIFDLKININNFEEVFFYEDMKNTFLHYMIEINNPLQLELLLAMTLLITKSDLIWKVTDDDNMFTRYYLLRNVKEL